MSRRQQGTSLADIAAGKPTAKAKAAPKESDFVSKAVDRLKKIGGAWEKRHGTAFGKAGQPDITGCLCGQRIEIEAKVGSNEPTDIQLERLAEWNKAGAACAVLWDGEPTNAAALKVCGARAKHQVDIAILHGLDDLETFARNIVGEPARNWPETVEVQYLNEDKPRIIQISEGSRGQ